MATTETTQNGGWPLQPHPCPRCGKKTIFRHCDACFSSEVARMMRNETPLPRTLDQVVSQADSGKIGGATDGDEFAATLVAVRDAPEQTPAVRWWSGMCLWCAKEIREQSGEDVTHLPPLSRIRTCYRHRKALLALSAWLRNEKFGQKGGAA